MRKSITKCLSGLILISFLVCAPQSAYAVDSVVLSQLSATSLCNWPSSNAYGALFSAGSAASVTKVRVQYDASTTDASFLVNQLQIYSDNSNALGSLLGTLNASSIDASTTLSGAAQATRTGTYTGNISLPSSGRFWLVQKSNGTSITACATSSAAIVSGGGWSQIMSGSSFQAEYLGGTLFTYSSIYSYEISIGSQDTTPPTITGPGSATGATSSLSISENTTSVFTFTASEAVTWSKSGTDNSFFSITSGGVLTITSRDFETKADSNADNVYVVVITAIDGASNATNQTLSVTITNVNEAPTITNNASAATYSISQAENISSVLTYTATDPDAGASLAWSLSGTDAGDFSIVSNTGVLTFVANPDYEAPVDSNLDNVYTVIVQVSDGSLTDTQTLTVTITNANESASLGTPSITGTVYKGQSITITVSSNVAGKVRFLVDGKRIATCLAKSTSGSYPTLSSSCSWKPSVQGSHKVTAQITPTDNTFSSSTSSAFTVIVLKRINTR